MTAQSVRLLSVYDRASLTSQFVGRQRELELIWNQYKAARGGSARIVIPLANPFKPHHRGEQKRNAESEREEAR